MLENLMFRFAQTGAWSLLAALALLVLTPLFLQRYPHLHCAGCGSYLQSGC